MGSLVAVCIFLPPSFMLLLVDKRYLSQGTYMTVEQGTSTVSVSATSSVVTSTLSVASSTRASSSGASSASRSAASGSASASASSTSGSNGALNNGVGMAVAGLGGLALVLQAFA